MGGHRCQSLPAELRLSLPLGHSLRQISAEIQCRKEVLPLGRPLPLLIQVLGPRPALSTPRRGLPGPRGRAPVRDRPIMIGSVGGLKITRAGEAEMLIETLCLDLVE